MTSRELLRIAVAGALSFSVTACASWNGSRVEATYGDAVRSNMQGQLYDPAAAANPPVDLVEGTDGQRMETVMEAHRSQSGDTRNVSDPIVLGINQ